MERSGLRDQTAQGTVEYVALLLLVALLFTGLLALTPLAAQGTRLVRALTERFVCAVEGSHPCGVPLDELTASYGPELAVLARAHAPEIRFEDGDYVSLPVDPRSCRERSCADTSSTGRLRESFEGEPPTVFARVIDCRDGTAPPEGVDCSNARAGYLYIQYWLYYPDSATRAYRRFGYHRDDWESYQVRIGPDGAADARASSHGSYNHEAGGVSDIGRKQILGLVTIDARRPGWGPDNGFLWVSEGSHAGRAAGRDSYFRSIAGEDLRLVPLEAHLAGLGRLEFDPVVAPPWLKEVYLDPEAIGT